MADTPFPTQDLQDQHDRLEEHLHDVEAQYARDHPKVTPMSPLIGQDIDESQHPGPEAKDLPDTDDDD